MKTIPKKVQPPLTKMIIYDLETYNEDTVVPYCSCINKLNKISGKYNRDITGKEYQKCLNECVVFKVSNCIDDMLDHVSSFKEEAK